MSQSGQGTARPVLVGVDGSAESREALRWAVDFGRRNGAPVEAIAAWSYPRVGSRWYSTTPPAPQPAAATKAVLDETVDAVLGPVEGARVGRRVTEGLPARVLVEASRSASALVVGTRGHGGFAGLLLGSVSSECAEHAACPVVVVHGSEPTDATDGPGAVADAPVVVGVDGSPGSREALRWAFDFAVAGSLPVEAVGVWGHPRIGYGFGWLGPSPGLWQPQGEMEAALDATIEQVLGLDGALVGRRVVEGSAPRVLLEASRDASALVVGSRGHGGFAGLLLGSVSTACAEHGSCPVVVVHGTAPPAPPLARG